MANLPLEGVRILSQGIVWAGPYATMYLADLGAEVIEVESTKHLNPTRATMRHVPPPLLAGPFGSLYPDRDAGERHWDRNGTWLYAKRNHLSMTVDMVDPRGRDLFLRLVSKADVFLENNAAGVVEKQSIDYEDLRLANPELVMVRFPGYGTWGPYKDFKGYGANVEALAGHTALRAYEDGDPTGIANAYYADPLAGMHVASAIIMALHYKSRTGKGQLIEVSQHESMLNSLARSFMDYSMNRRVQRSLGNSDTSKAPHECYPCRGEDEWIVISVGSDAEMAALAEVMGMPAIADDPRFADVVSRHRNRKELDSLIAEWTAGEDRLALMERLQAAGVTAAAVLKQREMFDDPHLVARGFFQTVPHPEAGAHPLAGPAYEMSRTPIGIRTPAPMLGEHNEYVYREILGLSEDEYRELVASGITGDTYVDSAT